MVLARLVAGALALAVAPNSTSVEKSEVPQQVVDQLAPVSQPAFAAYAPSCSAQCGWGALPFAR